MAQEDMVMEKEVMDEEVETSPMTIEQVDEIYNGLKARLETGEITIDELIAELIDSLQQENAPMEADTLGGLGAPGMELPSEETDFE